MVVTFLPTASPTVVWQERTASPLRCTVQAPQRPAPQPNFVPVICNCSRMAHSSGVSFAASTDIFRPLMFRLGIVSSLSGFEEPRSFLGPFLLVFVQFLAGSFPQ